MTAALAAGAYWWRNPLTLCQYGTPRLALKSLAGGA